MLGTKGAADAAAASLLALPGALAPCLPPPLPPLEPPPDPLLLLLGAEVGLSPAFSGVWSCAEALPAAPPLLLAAALPLAAAAGVVPALGAAAAAGLPAFRSALEFVPGTKGAAWTCKPDDSLAVSAITRLAALAEVSQHSASTCRGSSAEHRS